jgi:hypothetical protein
MAAYEKLPLRMGIKLIYKAIHDIDRERHWQLWVGLYPHMGKNNFIPFEQFYTAKPEDIKPKESKSKEEIIRNAMDITDKIASGNLVEVKI